MPKGWLPPQRGLHRQVSKHDLCQLLPHMEISTSMPSLLDSKLTGAPALCTRYGQCSWGLCYRDSMLLAAFYAFLGPMLSKHLNLLFSLVLSHLTGVPPPILCPLCPELTQMWTQSFCNQLLLLFPTQLCVWRMFTSVLGQRDIPVPSGDVLRWR